MSVLSWEPGLDVALLGHGALTRVALAAPVLRVESGSPFPVSDPFERGPCGAVFLATSAVAGLCYPSPAHTRMCTHLSAPATAPQSAGTPR